MDKNSNEYDMAEIIGEVDRHKWLESEKAGRDIGWEAAYRDWMRNHYKGWVEQREFVRDRWINNGEKLENSENRNYSSVNITKSAVSASRAVR